ncbi:MAG: response regulator transcription factor [Flavobacteriales bacterium]|nr:response regulator transcription factor [Flavobacteriales bacterium]
MSQSKLKIIHIEDEPQAREVVLGFVNRFLSEEVDYMGSAASLEEAGLLLSSCDFDIILLDVQLKDGSGLELIDKFPNLAASTILCTSDDTKGIEAVKKGIFDYLLKPLNILELKESLAKYKNKMATIPSEIGVVQGKLMVPDINGVEIVPFEQIVYLESDRNYTSIYLSNGSHLYVSKTMKYFEELLDSSTFLRIHKSNVVNVNFIKRINKTEGGSVELQDGRYLKLSPTGKELLKSRFKLL